jgi:hypothetical protein
MHSVRGCGVWMARAIGLLVALAMLLVFCAQTAQAGGPRWVAGSG